MAGAPCAGTIGRVNRSADMDNEDQTIDRRTAAFLREMTRLSHKYGIGIAGSSSLFVLERDDFALAFDSDDDGSLRLA